MSLKDPNNPSNTSEFLRRYVDAGVISAEEYETAIKEHDVHKDTSISFKSGIKGMELFDALDDLAKGKKDASEKLAKYVEEGKISNEAYKALIQKFGDIPNSTFKKKITNPPKALRKIVLIILCVVLLISLVVGSVIYHNNAIEDAFNEGKFNGETTGYARGYKIGYSKGYKAYEEIRSEYNFFHKYAVIVTSSGTKYHKYNCYHIKNRTFYIYNIGNAKAKGYTPCLDCY